jgi:Ser/Thr protein kinase RdoA (MazF antagonist)
MSSMTALFSLLNVKPGCRKDTELLRATAAQVQGMLAVLGTGRAAWGMIHADLHPGNMLWQQGRVGAIDFDDCGTGPYLFDLAVALYEWTAGGIDPGRYDAVLTGYTRVHTLPDLHPEVLRLLMAARCMRPIVAWLRRTRQFHTPPGRVMEMLAQLRRIVTGVAAGAPRLPADGP